MDMAQVSTTTNFPVTGLPQTFAQYRARFNPGNIIYNADVLNLVTIYNAFRSHTHTVTDIYYVAYGNANPFPSSSVSDTTGNMVPLPAAIVAPAAPQGNTIRVAVANYYIGRVMGITANHRHPIVDNWN
ncbi:MAG: hypothetical protein B7Y39_11945 [Bdellovibrio sp. 28-41-41]|nr:MAG: hypothetical protein B7Y39_11945 [Bdellovibrio sp. 28-41-41]